MKKITLSKDDVLHIAKLAKLKLTENEIEIYVRQLSSIIGFVSHLESVDTNKSQPSFQITDTVNIFRDDKVKESLSQEDAIRNAPESYNGFFKVKAIFK